jgi:uncharacterized membrane protein (DUF2068 family)
MGRKHDRGLLLIAIFKGCKGILLLILGLGCLRLLHKDVQAICENWINQFRIDPENRYVAALLAKAGLVNDHKLEELSALTLVYAALFLTEGMGLYMEKRWAEWLSIIATASLIPIEVYEAIKHFTAVKVVLLIVNLAIVGFLIVVVRRKDQRRSA